jgi:hypothetical protein
MQKFSKILVSFFLGLCVYGSAAADYCYDTEGIWLEEYGKAKECVYWGGPYHQDHHHNHDDYRYQAHWRYF